MSDFRRTNGSNTPSRFGRSSTEGFTRLARVVGRSLLWGCVLLLLVRGGLSVLSIDSRASTRTRGVTVTVTQPAHTETTQAQRK